MSKQRLLWVGVVLAAGWALSVAESAVAGDWTAWRGPEQTGVSREKGLVEDWSLEPRKNVKWVSNIGGRATPVVMNGRVYLNCRTPEDVNDPVEKVHSREQVVCFDANTGEVLWRDVFNVFQTDIPSPRVGWASLVGDPETGNIYLHSVSGIFRCYDRDGKRLWEHSLAEDFGKFSGYGGRTQTPIIDEDRVIVGFLARNWGESKGPGPKHTFYAFDKKTGALLWTSAPGGTPYDTTYSNPVIAVIKGQRMLICGNGDGGLHAINARTGAPIWSFRMSKRGLNSTPVVDGNYVYMAHGEDNIDTTAFGRVECIDATGTGDVTETHSVWRVNEVKSGYSGLLIKDDTLYVISDSGVLQAFDSKTGKELWAYDCGSVGKGSPVWADGKIYIMEVNGNVHIVRPSREGCEKLSHVELQSTAMDGLDEIYASPAVADGKVYLVTRDRTICLAKEGAEPVAADPVVGLPEEAPATEEIATIQLVPFETTVMGPGEVTYELRAFDKNGRFVKTMAPELMAKADLTGVQVQGNKLVVADPVPLTAGYLEAKVGDLTAKARIRVFPPLPWNFDFNDGKTPAGWIDGFALPVAEVEGEKAVKKATGRGRPSFNSWIGPSTMTDYTVQADVRMEEETRRLPSVGITANRYNLILKGNTAKLSVQSWAPHMRMAKEIRYISDPKVWYTLKLRVDRKDGQAFVRGKIWKRGEAEPAEWTIEAVDPHPNDHGSPGIHCYSLAATYVDNLSVTANTTE